MFFYLFDSELTGRECRLLNKHVNVGALIPSFTKFVFESTSVCADLILPSFSWRGLTLPRSCLTSS